MSAALATWIDGVPAEVLPADDRGLHYGDGLFETLMVRAGRPRFLDLHLRRLALGAERLRIPLPPLPVLRDELARLADQAPSLGILKLVLTRGSATKRGYAPSGDEQARRILSLWPAQPLPPETREGVHVVMAAGRCAENETLGGIKHLGRLENVLASREAQSSGAFDALMSGSKAELISGAMRNLFLVTGDRLRTPQVRTAGVAGVMRAVVFREAGTLGLGCEETLLTPEDLFASDEAFLTNARIGVVPVKRVGEHAFTMPRIALRLARHIEGLDA
jgi:4-amino-4-deoxychorismate lyase